MSQWEETAQRYLETFIDEQELLQVASNLSTLLAAIVPESAVTGCRPALGLAALAYQVLS